MCNAKVIQEFMISLRNIPIKNNITWRNVNPIFMLCIGYYLIMAIVAPGFTSMHNSWNIVISLMPLMIIAIGQTYVMIGAGIDLSVTSIVALSSIVGGYWLSDITAVIDNVLIRILVALIFMILTGALVGLFNGISVTKLGMPAFMVTLTTMMLFSGTAIWLTKSQNFYLLPEAFVQLPYTGFIGIPYPVLIGAAVALIGYVFLRKTLYGEWLYAVGMNPKVARISGVKTDRTIVLSYVFCGCCASVASILYTARLETGSPVMGQHILLDVIGAVVIGGTSLFGGVGRVQWTIIGAIFMTLLDNSLNLLGLSYFLIMIVKGSVILIAALVNLLKNKRR